MNDFGFAHCVVWVVVVVRNFNYAVRMIFSVRETFINQRLTSTFACPLSLLVRRSLLC